MTPLSVVTRVKVNELTSERLVSPVTNFWIVSLPVGVVYLLVKTTLVLPPASIVPEMPGGSASVTVPLLAVTVVDH